MKRLPVKILTYKMQPASGELASFSQLGKLYQAALASPADAIMLDCASIAWIDAHTTAGYRGIAALLKDQRKTLHFVNLIPVVEQILNQHHLIGVPPAKPKKSVIPVTSFSPGDAKKFAQYTQDGFTKMPIPSMSPQVESKFFEGIDELFSNSELHSKTKHGMFACGQFFPQKNKVDFTLVDLGIGFCSVLAQSRNIDLAPNLAIDWAMTGNNTTRSGDIPGGLGLKLLTSFIKHNQGRLSVISYTGHWCLAGSKIKHGILPYEFPGTAITLEIDTADKKAYYLKEENGSWRTP